MTKKTSIGGQSKAKVNPAERIDAIKKRLEAGMAGPWETGDGYDGTGIGIYGMGMEVANVQDTIPDTAEFIAHAPADIRYLLDEIEMLKYSLREAGLRTYDGLVQKNVALREENARLKETLELIAAPKRADGTYNRSREACELLAKEALGKE